MGMQKLKVWIIKFMTERGLQRSLDMVFKGRLNSFTKKNELTKLHNYFKIICFKKAFQEL